MIHNIRKVGDSSYLLNESVVISVSEDMVATAEYDEKILTEKEVEEMIDDFFNLAEKIMIKN